jgi:hypothetical protein
MTVGSFHQVGLRSSTHLADEAASFNRHYREDGGRPVAGISAESGTL